MIPMTSKIQRIGPVMKPIEKPNNHKIKRIIPITKSNVNIVTPFLYLETFSIFTADISFSFPIQVIFHYG